MFIEIYLSSISLQIIQIIIIYSKTVDPRSMDKKKEILHSSPILVRIVELTPRFCIVPGPLNTRYQCSDDVGPKDGVERHPNPPLADGARKPR